MLNILLTLHIVCFGMAMSLTAGVGIALERIAAGRDARVIHKAFTLAGPLPKVGGPLWFVTAGLGFAIALLAGLPLETPWLVASYVVFVVLAAVGLGIHAPWQARVARLSAADAANGEAVGPELAAVLASPLEKFGSLATPIGIVLLTWLMIAKPGG